MNKVYWFTIDLLCFALNVDSPLSEIFLDTQKQNIELLIIFPESL